MFRFKTLNLSFQYSYFLDGTKSDHSLKRGHRQFDRTYRKIGRRNGNSTRKRTNITGHKRIASEKKRDRRNRNEDGFYLYTNLKTGKPYSSISTEKRGTNT